MTETRDREDDHPGSSAGRGATGDARPAARRDGGAASLAPATRPGRSCRAGQDRGRAPRWRPADLVALAVKLELARGTAESDPAGTKALLEEVAREVQQALGETARLAQRIYPGLLEARGLAVALRAVATSAGAPASVEVAAGSGRRQTSRPPSTSAGSTRSTTPGPAAVRRSASGRRTGRSSSTWSQVPAGTTALRSYATASKPSAAG